MGVWILAEAQLVFTVPPHFLALEAKLKIIPKLNLSLSINLSVPRNAVKHID